MGLSRVPDSEAPGADGTAELRGAALFKLIWDAVADVLGPTPTATLLRRAAQRATPRSPELGELTMVRTEAGLHLLTTARAGREARAYASCGARVGRRASAAAGGIDGASRRPP